jgi:AcrR family transcriptional regulator
LPRIVAEKANVIPLLAEVFREHGYEGATLSRIQDGIGGGSLYQFFPGGKEDMAAAVLVEIDVWFEQHLFEPRRQAYNVDLTIKRMFEKVTTYFRSGGRVCLMGAFALTDARDRFGLAVGGYFLRWIEALAEDAVLGIQARLSLLGRWTIRRCSSAPWNSWKRVHSRGKDRQCRRSILARRSIASTIIGVRRSRAS